MAWAIDLDPEDTEQWTELKSYLLVQGLIECIDGGDPLDGKSEMVVTMKGRRVWAVLNVARELEARPG